MKYKIIKKRSTISFFNNKLYLLFRLINQLKYPLDIFNISKNLIFKFLKKINNNNFDLNNTQSLSNTTPSSHGKRCKNIRINNSLLIPSIRIKL